MKTPNACFTRTIHIPASAAQRGPRRRSATESPAAAEAEGQRERGVVPVA